MEPHADAAEWMWRSCDTLFRASQIVLPPKHHRKTFQIPNDKVRVFTPLYRRRLRLEGAGARAGNTGGPRRQGDRQAVKVAPPASKCSRTQNHRPAGIQRMPWEHKGMEL